MYVLILAKVIPTAWYVMLIHMYYDMIANLVVVLSMGRRPSRMKRDLQVGFENITATGNLLHKKSKETERDTNFFDHQLSLGGACNKVNSEESSKAEHSVMVFQGQPDPEDDADRREFKFEPPHEQGNNPLGDETTKSVNE